MTTLETIRVDTTGAATTVRMTLAYTASVACDRCGSEEANVNADRRVDVTWTTDYRGLRSLRQMVNGAPGVLVPVVQVAGSITRDGGRAFLAAVRTRPVIEWNAGRPTITGVQIEFVGGDSSEQHLLDGYATLGLTLDTDAWSTMRDAIEMADPVLPPRE